VLGCQIFAVMISVNHERQPTHQSNFRDRACRVVDISDSDNSRASMLDSCWPFRFVSGQDSWHCLTKFQRLQRLVSEKLISKYDCILAVFSKTLWFSDATVSDLLAFILLDSLCKNVAQ